MGWLLACTFGAPDPTSSSRQVVGDTRAACLFTACCSSLSMANGTDEGSNDKLGEMLVREQVISPDQLRKAKRKSDKEGNRLGYELTKLGYVDEGDLTSFLSEHHGVPSVDLNDLDIPTEVIDLVPEKLAKRHQCIPVNRSGSTLVVAMADPSNIYAIDDLRFSTGYDIEVVVATETAIENAIDRCYQASAAEVGESVEYDYDEILGDLDIDDVDYVEEDDDGVDVNDLAQASEDAPVVRLVNMILIEAIEKGASDIHIEPYEDDFRVRFRVDGVLQEMMHPPMKLKKALISRVKIMASLDIAERRLPQDGRIKLKLGPNREMDFRVSCLPTMFGEKIVLRLLDKSNLQLDMTKLGFEPAPLDAFQSAIHEPYGMCLVTGPTGSGKTTTLYSALSELNQISENVCTAEDPVEFNLEGINQAQMKEDIGFNFATALRSFLRQDPDIIMVGEVRDFETAEIAIKAALTGHMVLSTLHTNDAPSTVSRLLNMGIEPFLVTSALNVVVAQRLCRRICTECKEPYEDFSVEDRRKMEVPEQHLDEPVYHGVGCEACDDTGYSGRVAVFEVLDINDEFKNYIIQGYSSAELKQEAIRMGMSTLRQAGIKKMIEGVTSPEEVVRNTAPDG
jgi:type IV pilus assembly protein PilB